MRQTWRIMLSDFKSTLFPLYYPAFFWEAMGLRLQNSLRNGEIIKSGWRGLSWLPCYSKGTGKTFISPIFLLHSAHCLKFWHVLLWDEYWGHGAQSHSEWTSLIQSVEGVGALYSSSVKFLFWYVPDAQQRRFPILAVNSEHCFLFSLVRLSLPLREGRGAA